MYEQQDVYHLFYAYYVIDKALNMCGSSDICFRDAMFAIQKQYQEKPMDSDDFHYKRVSTKRFYRTGLQKLKPYWQALDFVRDIGI